MTIGPETLNACNPVQNVGVVIAECSKLCLENLNSKCRTQGDLPTSKTDSKSTKDQRKTLVLNYAQMD